MTVLGSNISWTHSTWNTWIGCDKVSAGCDNCYAEELVTRLSTTFKQRFDEVKLRLDRLTHVSKFKPVPNDQGGVSPHMVFVNSMSDFWHNAVPSDVLHKVLDVMEANPSVVFQILTKRPIRARTILVARYGNSGIPRHIWIGVSAEDNRVRRRLDIMRSIKDRTGGSGTFFVSCEPIVEATDQLDFSGHSWVITGGESGPRARKMERAWLMPALENTLKLGIPLWHKQNGKTASHPNIDRVPSRLEKPADQMRWLRDNGWEKLGFEKGGATVDHNTYRQLPEVYHAMKADMGSRLL